jgi:hypothetical protein
MAPARPGLPDGARVLPARRRAVAVSAIRLIGRGEASVTVALWFHTSTVVMAAIPLAVGWPQQAVVPLPGDLVLLLGVALSSFCGQLLMTRGLQLIPAAQASAASFAQVREGAPAPVAPPFPPSPFPPPLLEIPAPARPLAHPPTHPPTQCACMYPPLRRLSGPTSGA